MRRGLLLAAFTAAVCLAQSDTSRGFVNQRVFSGKFLSSAPQLRPLTVRPRPRPPAKPFFFLERNPANKDLNWKLDRKMIVPRTKKPVDPKMIVHPPVLQDKQDK